MKRCVDYTDPPASLKHAGKKNAPKGVEFRLHGERSPDDRFSREIG